MAMDMRNYEELTVNPNWNLAEQLDDLGIREIDCIGYKEIYNAIYDNCLTKIWMDEVGQIWIPGLYDIQYVARVRL